MIDSAGRDEVKQLPRLSKSEDFSNLCGQVRVTFQPQRLELLDLTANFAVDFTLADEPLSHIRAIVDDDQALTKDLWYELDKSY